MKTKQIAVLTILSVLLVTSLSRAGTVTATGSGKWNSTVPDAPWPGGVVPQSTDNADIEAPFNVTVDTNATIDYIYGTGTVTVGTNATLNVVGNNAGEGTQMLGLLDTSAPGNTVNYQGNAFFCKHQNYYNLILGGFGTLYNGEIGISGDGDMAMTIAGNLTLAGTASVQQADSFTIMGNLTIGPGSHYDSSCSPVTVIGNTIVNGTLTDGCGSTATLDDVFNNMTIGSTGTWNLGDVVEWSIGGSLTNNGTMVGKGYGTVTFVGTGVIAGSSPVTAPYLAFNGTATIEDTVTTTTNTPGFNGTLIFDLAHPGKVIVPAYLGQPLYYNGNLTVVDTGAAPVAGNTYQLFSAPSYNDPYTFTTITLPNLASGLMWVNSLTTNGSISVSGPPVNAPTLSAVRSGNNLTLSWDSTTFPGYSVQAQTNKNGVGANWSATGSGTVSPFMTTIIPTNPPVFYRLHQ